jgi:hypothetical protein
MAPNAKESFDYFSAGLGKVMYPLCLMSESAPDKKLTKDFALLSLHIPSFYSERKACGVGSSYWSRGK